MEARILYGIAVIAVVVYVMMYVHQVADFRRNGVHPIGRGTVITTWILLISALGGFGGGWYQSHAAKAETKPAQHRIMKDKHQHKKSHAKDDSSSSASTKQDDGPQRTNRQARTADEPTPTNSSRTRQATSTNSRRQATRSRSTTSARYRSSSQVAATPAASGVTSNDNGGVTNNNQVDNAPVAVVSDTGDTPAAADATPAVTAPDAN